MVRPRITNEEVNNLPTAQFEGEIIVIETIEDAEKAIEELKNHNLVGIDTETRPSFKRGVRYNMSLIQIATNEKAFLFRLNKIGFPDSLKQYISNPRVSKIGLSLRDDFNGLSKYTRIGAKGFIDVQDIAKNYGILELSLQKIFAILFEKKISKSQRLTNWDRETLTKKQEIYAATDAWATLQIFERLNKEKKLKKIEIDELIAQDELSK